MRILIAISPFLSDLSSWSNCEFVLNPWGRNPTEEELEIELVQGNYDGLIIGTRNVRNSIAEKCPTLKVISRVGVGYNNIDVEHFKKYGVVTAYTPSGPTASTAEMAVAMMMAGTRRLRNYDMMVRKGIWERSFGIRLMDATVGIAGFGRIGKKVAELIKVFGCRIIVHDCEPDYEAALSVGAEVVTKSEIIEHSDILTIHMPLKQDTINWLDAGALSKLKQSITIVNTARGGIVDESAVFEYLKNHPEAYYCCDVFEEEPYFGALSEIENCLLTPHAATFTVGSRYTTEQMALKNCCAILNGERCEDIAYVNL